MPPAPLLPFTVAYAIGILLYAIMPEPLWTVGIGLLGAGLFAAKLRYSALMVFAVACGLLVAAVNYSGSPPEKYSSYQCQWSGVVRDIKQSESMQIAVMLVDSAENEAVTPFLVKALIPYHGTIIGEGDRMTFTGGMRNLEPRTDLPDEIDFDNPLRIRGVRYEIFIVPDSIGRISPATGFLSTIRQLRYRISGIIAEVPLDSDSRSFLIAILAGDREYLTQDMRDNFMISGIAHILALSGLHVGIITIIFSILLFPLTVTGHRHLGNVLVITLLWGFAVMTGLGASVVRATLMATMYVVSSLLQRRWSPLNALSASALIILTVDPTEIYSIGFQLSFTAVLSIILLAPLLNPMVRFRGIFRHIGSWIAASVAATLGTGVISMFYFHIFPVYFIIANTFVAPLLPVILGIGIVIVLLGWAGIHIIWICSMVDILIHWVMSASNYISSLPGAVVGIAHLPLWSLPLFMVCVIMLGIGLYRRSIAWPIASVLLCGFVSIWVWLSVPHYPDHELYITRSTTETNLLIKHDTRLFSITTALPSAVSGVLSRDSLRYTRYMTKRNISRLEQLPIECDFGTSWRHGDMVMVCEKIFMVVSHNPPFDVIGDRIDYLLVCKGFRDNVTGLTEALSPDTVLLSSDLNKRRHDRYARELTEAGVPWRSLRDGVFYLRR